MKETTHNLVILFFICLFASFAITKCSSCIDKDRVFMSDCLKTSRSIDDCKAAVRGVR